MVPCGFPSLHVDTIPGRLLGLHRRQSGRRLAIATDLVLLWMGRADGHLLRHQRGRPLGGGSVDCNGSIITSNVPRIL